MQQKKLHIRKGDTVKLIAGNEKGASGKVLRVDHKKNRAFVEGLNIASKHTKPNAANPQGNIVKKEAGIQISNLMVVDAQGNATRIGRRYNDDNKLVRYSKKTGEEIK